MSVVAVDDGYDLHVVVPDGTWVVRVPELEVARRFAVYRLIDGTPPSLDAIRSTL